MGENVWWFLADHCGLDKVWLCSQLDAATKLLWLGVIHKLKPETNFQMHSFLKIVLIQTEHLQIKMIIVLKS